MRFAPVFRLLARLHLWPQAVLVGRYGSRVARWDHSQSSRFAYACMMGRRHPIVRQCFARILRRELDFSPTVNLWLALIAWQMSAPQLSQLLYRRTIRLYPNTPEAAVANREAEFARGLEKRLHLQTITALVDGLTLGPREELILVPVSSSYDSFFQVWRSQLLLYARGRLLVLAMDPASFRIYSTDPSLTVVDISRYFGFDDSGRVEDYSKRHLWVLRVLVIRELVRRSHRVISLDLDAVLLANLDDLLASLPEADIVAQKDYSIPVEVARKLGFILCCGFMVFFPTPACRAFLDLYADQCSLELDDQVALNHLLAAQPLQKRSETKGRLTFESCGVRWVCPATSLVSRDLDHGTVVRHFTQRGETVDELRKRLGIS